MKGGARYPKLLVFSLVLLLLVTSCGKPVSTPIPFSSLLVPEGQSPTFSGRAS